MLIDFNSLYTLVSNGLTFQFIYFLGRKRIKTVDTSNSDSDAEGDGDYNGYADFHSIVYY